jgi:Arc/MetJ-type ribon-helix-helix transcriptional regulator
MKEHHIEISADASAYVLSQLGKGAFANASDYIESLIREDQLTREQLDRITADHRGAMEKLAIEGHQSGDAIEVDAAYWQKKRQCLTDEFGG